MEPMEQYFSRDRIVTARFLDDHTPRAEENAAAAYVVCACGWDSRDSLDPNAWVKHLTDALNAALPTGLA